MSKNPFNRFKSGAFLNMGTANPSQTSGGNRDPFNVAATTDDPKAWRAPEVTHPTPIAFPPHLYIPEGAQGIDIRKVVSVAPATVDATLFEFIAPAGALTHFISYCIFNDGDDAANFEFFPTVDGHRVFPYHGDPALKYKIYLGLAPDFSNGSAIPCQLTLQPNQKLRWGITNTSAVATSMGVRMVGYFDTSGLRTTKRFGG